MTPEPPADEPAAPEGPVDDTPDYTGDGFVDPDTIDNVVELRAVELADGSIRLEHNHDHGSGGHDHGHGDGGDKACGCDGPCEHDCAPETVAEPEPAPPVGDVGGAGRAVLSRLETMREVREERRERREAAEEEEVAEDAAASAGVSGDAEANAAGDGGAVTASATLGEGGLLERYISGGDPATRFNIELVFSGDGWTTDLQSDFIAAADYLSTYIRGDMPEATLSGGRGTTDDLLIEAALIDIDGTNGVLGRAGPREYRGDLTVERGIMEFDTADAERFDDRGLWDDIVLHEMMHVLGLGTTWGLQGMTNATDVDAGLTDTLRFTGDRATAVYQQEFAGKIADDDMAAGVPIEQDFGSGTAGSHWDEALFTNELATGRINNANYVSLTTIAALDDLGYDTVIDDFFQFDDQGLIV